MLELCLGQNPRDFLALDTLQYAFFYKDFFKKFTYVCMCRNDPFKNICGSSNFLERMTQYRYIIFLIISDSPENSCTII